MADNHSYEKLDSLLKGILKHTDEMINYYEVKLKTPTLDDFFKKSLKDCEKRKKLLNKMIKKLNTNNYENIYNELKKHEMI